MRTPNPSPVHPPAEPAGPAAQPRRALQPLPNRKVRPPSPWAALRTGAPLVLGDLVALAATLLLVDLLHRMAAAAPADFLFAAPAWSLATLLAGGRLLRLWPGTGLSPVQELRRLGALAALLALPKAVAVASPAAAGALLGWLGGFVFVAFALRSRLRRLLAATSWWGERAVVVGLPSTCFRAQRMLACYRRQGLIPVARVVVLPGDRSALPVAARALRAAEHHGATWSVVTPEVGVRWRAIDRLLWAMARPHALMLTALPGGGSGLHGAPLPLLGYEGRAVTNGALQPVAMALRRAAAVGSASLLLLLLLPALLLAGLALRWSGHAVWQRTWMLGRDGSLFQLLRFAAPRSHWVARWHVDGLPMLWNIVRGDLAWFGPAPLALSGAAQRGALQPFHLAVRPGLLGLSQLGALAGASPGEQIRLDVEQATGRSPALDCAIALRTLARELPV